MNRKVRPASPLQAPPVPQIPQDDNYVCPHRPDEKGCGWASKSDKILTILLAEIAGLPCNVSQIYCEFQQL